MNEIPNEIVEDSKIIDAKKVLDVKVIRNPKHGLQIKLQSAQDWSFLRVGDTTRAFKIGGVLCHMPKKERIEDVPGYFHPRDSWEYENYPNLCMLLATELSHGVVFNFGMGIVSEEKILMWIARLKEQVKSLYLIYLKPVKVEVFFTTETVEKSLED